MEFVLALSFKDTILLLMLLSQLSLSLIPWPFVFLHISGFHLRSLHLVSWMLFSGFNHCLHFDAPDCP